MKFERQRGTQAVPDKYDLNNQEFLTFRNNPTAENSGRSVYSQQFDYRSLDRYDKTDEKAEPSYIFRKNVKNLRSTDKYRQLKEEALLFQTTEENTESPAGSVERREELKNRLNKLKKNMKKQLRREAALKEQIAQVEGQLQDLEETCTLQRNDIEELREIMQDNDKNSKQIRRSKEILLARKAQIQELIESISIAIESEKTNRSNEPSPQERHKQQLLTLGLEKVEAMSQDLSERIEYVREEIESTQDKLEDLMELDEQMRQMLRKRGHFE